MAPYSERECEGAWGKTSSRPYKKNVKKTLNEQAAAKKAGEKENGERERTREGEKGEAVFNRA